MMTTMQPAPRHQCLIYKGAPSKHLPALAEAMREKLRQNYRCLYLNSPPMVAGLRSYIAAAGVDVAQEVARGRLILSSDRQHLADGSFDIDRMLRTLENLLDNSLRDGHTGLWAVGDMTWELGPLGSSNTSGVLKHSSISVPSSAASASITPILCLAR